MITETGKITEIKKVHGEMFAQVECISKSACSGCSSNSSCGVGSVSKSFSDKTHRFEVPYKEGMKVDGFVDLQISNGDLIKSASLVYLLPLLFFISSALILKSYFLLNETAVIGLSVVFATLGFIVTRFIANKRFLNKPSKDLIATQINHS